MDNQEQEHNIKTKYRPVKTNYAKVGMKEKTNNQNKNQIQDHTPEPQKQNGATGGIRRKKYASTKGTNPTGHKKINGKVNSPVYNKNYKKPRQTSEWDRRLW